MQVLRPDIRTRMSMGPATESDQCLLGVLPIAGSYEPVALANAIHAKIRICSAIFVIAFGYRLPDAPGKWNFDICGILSPSPKR